MNYLKKFIIFIILFTAFYSVTKSQTQWIIRSTGCNLNSVFFYDEMNGWAVGDSGLIIATADAGANWQCLFSGTSQSLKSVFFINGLTGWVSGDGGVILKTTNAGSNWLAESSGTSMGLGAIHFPTADTGYAVGATYVKTTNGGSNWFSAGAFTGSAVYFSSGLVGLIPNSTTYLTRTTNGGISYFSTSGAGFPSGGFCISFLNASTGWTGSGNRIFKTTNGGNNWTISVTPASVFTKFYGLDFTDDLNGFTAGTTGQIYASTNGGTNWVSKSSGTTQDLRSVSFIDAFTGWIVGDQGTILYTSDGGSTFSKQLIKYSAPFTQTLWLFDVQFKNEMTGWSVGMDGYVNKTTDGGDSWITYSSASFNYLYSIFFPNENDTGWACGRLGTIEKTINGGINWVIQPSSTSQHLNCIVVDKTAGGVLNNAICVGDNGTILRFDSAMTWTASVSGTTNHLNSAVLLDEYKAVIAGNAGTILKTTDAGNNWIAKTSGTTEDLKSVYFINSSTGYVCGSLGTIRMTIDGGDSWTAQSSGTTSTLNSIDFEETITDNGYAVGENGTIVSTSNGGITWNSEASGGTTNLFSVFVKEVPSTSGLLSTVISSVGRLAKYITKKTVTALPVELTSFNYSVYENNVELEWQTSGEQNNKGFDIERSDVNKDKWIKIGFVNGNGNSGSQNYYSFSDKNLNSGKYSFRLKQIDYNGNYHYHNLNSEVVIENPDNFKLLQNYPNPFNPTTTINYQLTENNYVSLKIYDIAGREVSTLVNDNQISGFYSVKFDGSSLSSGVYFYRLKTGLKEETRKMTLVK